MEEETRQSYEQSFHMCTSQLDISFFSHSLLSSLVEREEEEKDNDTHTHTPRCSIIKLIRIESHQLDQNIELHSFMRTNQSFCLTIRSTELRKQQTCWRYVFFLHHIRLIHWTWSISNDRRKCPRLATGVNWKRNETNGCLISTKMFREEKEKGKDRILGREEITYPSASFGLSKIISRQF